MFTGLIEQTGKIESVNQTSKGSNLTIWTGKDFLINVSVGDSIAINGTCLTVTDMSQENFSAFASLETLNLTTLQFIKRGNFVNLEKPMTPEKFFGGHIVQGHVDGIGEVISIEEWGEAKNVTIKLPSPSHTQWVVPKGSIAIDGVSLTINEVNNDTIRVTIIPHTWEVTIFKYYKPGTKVNIEYDIVAKYVAKMVEAWNNKDETIKEAIENSPYFNKGG